MKTRVSTSPEQVAQWQTIQANRKYNAPVAQECRALGLDLARLAFYKSLALGGEISG